MDQYTIITLGTAQQMLRVLKDRKVSLRDAYKTVLYLMPSGWPALKDVHGIVGEAGSLALEADSGNHWKQAGLHEEHWFFGEADLAAIGCFKNNGDGQYLTRDDMIRLVQGHIHSLKPANRKSSTKTTRTLAQAEREISRLQALLRKNAIPF